MAECKCMDSENSTVPLYTYDDLKIDKRATTGHFGAKCVLCQQLIKEKEEEIICGRCSVTLHYYYTDLSGKLQRNVFKPSQCCYRYEGSETEWWSDRDDYQEPELMVINQDVGRHLPMEILALCRERLKIYYRTTNAYIQSWWWKGSGNDLPIHEYFVNLKIEMLDLLGRRKETIINIEEIFSEAKEEYRSVILITGKPGNGKTTLCHKIAYDWSTTKTTDDYLEQFYFVVIVHLCHLRRESVLDTVVETIFGKSEVISTNDLLKGNLNTLIILDGYDEVLNKNSVIDFVRSHSFKISSRMTIIITSRPGQEKEIREDANFRFSLEGFSQTQQQKYIGLFFDGEQYLQNRIRNDVILLNWAKCPLTLHMLCTLHQSQRLSQIRRITDLYSAIITLLIDRYLTENPLMRGRNQGLVKKYLPCFKEERGILKRGTYFWGENLIFRLTNLWTTRKFTFENLKNVFSREELNFVLGIGIIQRYYCIDEVQYAFAHRTIFEFLQTITNYEEQNQFSSVPKLEDGNFLFHLGLFGDKPLHKYLMDRLNTQFLDVETIGQALKEMRNKNNLTLFCSKAKLAVSPEELDKIILLWPSFRFSEIYLRISHYATTSEHEYRRYLVNSLLEFHENYPFPTQLQIHLMVEKPFHLQIIRGIYDIRQQAELMIEIFRKIEGLNKFKVYLTAVDTTPIEYFEKVKLSKIVPETIRKELVAYTKQEFVLLKSNFEDFLISLQQYNVLKRRIKISASVKRNTSRCKSN